MSETDEKKEIREAIAAVLAGDSDAYRVLVRRYSPAVYAVLGSRVADTQALDDLVQETFIAGYQALGRFDASRDFGAWIKGIARNKMLMYFREAYARRDVVVELQDDVLTAVWHGADEAKSSANLDERLALLRKCLTQLPERAQMVLQAKYFNEKSVILIAEELETTVDAVSCLLYRARRQLKVCMEAHADDF